MPTLRLPTKLKKKPKNPDIITGTGSDTSSVSSSKHPHHIQPLSRPSYKILGPIVVLVAGIGIYSLLFSKAATPTTVPTKANVWVDKNGGLCTYSATPVDYSDAAACGTFDTAWDKASSGDTIVVKNGTYGRQFITGDKASDTYIIGESKSGVVVTDTSGNCRQSFGASTILCADGNYIWLENITVDTNSEDGPAPGSLIAGQNVTYKNVDIFGWWPDISIGNKQPECTGCDGTGFTWDGGTYGDVNPPPRNCGAEPGGNGEPIEVWYPDVTINDITFNKQTGKTEIQYGGTCAAGDNPHIEFIRLESGANNVIVSNNTFMPGSDSGSGYIFSSVSVSNFRIIGNFFADNTGSTWMQVSQTTPSLIAYNTFSGNDDAVTKGNSLWVGNLGPIVQKCYSTNIKNVWGGTGSCGTDKFVGNNSLGVDSTGHLTSTLSPAYDAAETVSDSDYCTGSIVGSVDFEGYTRPAGNACDAGAHEYGSTPASEGGQTANLWIDNTITTGTCTRSATSITYAQASTAPSKTCSTFQAAANSTLNGQADTIVVKKGNTTAYSANLSNITRNPKITIYAENNGTSIVSGGTFAFVDGISIDGTTGANKQGFIEAGEGGGYTFSGASDGMGAVKNFDLKGVRTRGGLYMTNCSNINIDQVEIYDMFKGDDSIQMSSQYLGPGSYRNPCSNVTFDHLNIHNINCDGKSGDHLDFIQILSGHDILVKNSRMVGMTCHTISGDPSGAQGWFVSGGFEANKANFYNISLENSVIVDLDSAGGGESVAVYIANGVRIANNTLDGTIKTESSPNPPSNVTFINNITNSSCGGIYGVDTLFNKKGTGSYANNVFSGTACYPNNGDKLTQNFEANFVNPTGGDYHLKAGAFAIDKGTNTGCTTTDFDNDPRPQGAGCDAGADEYTGTTSGGDTTPPVTTLNTTATGTPASSTTSTSATFTFSANEASAFQCKLDTAAYASCSSPKAYTGLTVGSHTFSVKATDTAGNAEITAKTYSWTITTSTSTCPTKAGDVNGDGSVNITDIGLVLSAYGQSTTTNCADLDKSGSINIQDLSIILSKYGT